MLTQSIEELPAHGHVNESFDDDLVFGHWCFACGNSTDGSPYCSTECRKADAKSKVLLSPDLSPTLSAVPGLIRSNKSSTSSSPSSPSGSPAALAGADSTDDDEPPRLELPALANKITFGASSLPMSIRYPRHQPSQEQDHRMSEQQGKSVDAISTFEPFQYSRKHPAQIPSPLYFRQRAAHASPALSAAVTSPQVKSTKATTQASPMISAITLPPAKAQAPHVIRPDVSSQRSTSMRKTSSQMDSPDLLLSPRIRALRSDSLSVKDEDGDNNCSKESAFASYLFAHLAYDRTQQTTRDDRSLDRGRRRATIGEGSLEDKRSTSADAVPTRTFSSGRPPRFLFGRGASALPSPSPTAEVEDTFEDLSIAHHPRPGQLIHATVPTESSSSSWVSSPGAGGAAADDESVEGEGFARGRPAAKRAVSNVSGPSVEFVEPTPDPRGRSMLRGMGAVKRSMSPKAEQSRSRGRSRDSTSHRRRSP